MPAVIVISCAVRGRARLYVDGLRRARGLSSLLEDRLGWDDRVHQVRASDITGNLLVLFDADRLSLGELKRRVASEAAAFRAGGGRREPSAPSQPPALRSDSGAWHTRPAADAIRALDAAPTVGLATDEVERRLQLYGANRLPTPQPKSAFEIIREQVGSVPVLLLGGAAVLSIATGGLIDGAAILAVIAVNAAIGYATETRVERILASLNEVGLPMALVRRDSREQLVPRAELVPGDVMLLRPGHDVPADGRVIAVRGLQVDESALTGESLAVAKAVDGGVLLDAPVADRINMVYAGTVVADGAGEAIVTATGRRTELGRIRALISDTRAPRTPLEQQLDTTGRQLALASLGICSGLFVAGVLRGLPAFGVFRTAASLAVAAVPEGLPTVATTTMALGMRRMFERRTLVRRLAAVESLGATTVICVDKTGTVTENRMTVGRWHVTGRDYTPDALAPGALAPALERALSVGVLCSEATLSVDQHGAEELRGSATETALLAAARVCGIEAAAVREEHPLLAMSPRGEGRNWMGSMHTASGHRLVAVKGAPEEVLRGCVRWVTDDGDGVLDGPARRRILSANDRMADEGMRVLGLAFATLEVDADMQFDALTWIGLVGLIDPIRPGVRDAIAICHQAGIRPVMITGDQALTAVAVGRKLGLIRDGQIRVLEARELARLDAEALRGVVRGIDVFARVAPAQKYEIVRALQAGGAVVAMTGDGVNDGPAIKAADIGVAMGERGTEMARDIADVVLMDDDLRSIVGAVEQGRTLRANLRKALRFLLATNFAEVLVTVGAVLVARAQPLSALHLLWINLVTDVVPALALGLEPAEPGVMRRPPPVPGEPLLTREAFTTMGMDAAIMAATTLGAFAVTNARGAAPGHASTVAFSTLSMGQLLYALACRSDERAGVRGLRENPALVGGVGGMLVLQAATLVFPPLRSLLRTTPLGVADLAVVAAGAATPLMVRETLKTLRRSDPQDGGTRG